MSANQLSALLAAVAADPHLEQRFAGLASIEDAVHLAAELGYQVSAEELSTAISQAASGELSDAELANASGGTGYYSQATCTCVSMYGAGCD